MAAIVLNTLGTAYTQDFNTLSNVAGTHALSIDGWTLSESGGEDRIRGVLLESHAHSLAALTGQQEGQAALDHRADGEVGVGSARGRWVVGGQSESRSRHESA